MSQKRRVRTGRRHETFIESATPMGMVVGAAVLVGGFPVVGGVTFLAFYALHRARKAKERAESAELMDPTYYATWSSYEEYLESDVWGEKRLQVLKRCGGQCEAPGCTLRATEIHHKKYPRHRSQLGNEPIEWLLGLCAAHHRDEHFVDETSPP